MENEQRYQHKDFPLGLAPHFRAARSFDIMNKWWWFSLGYFEK